MAIVSNVLIGKASGSVGNATFSTWKGKNVLKEKATSVANPNTDPQQMRRSALTQIVTIFRVISAVVNVGFKKQAIKKSAYNAFAGAALKNSFNFSAPPTATLVPADLLISKGTISPTAISSVVADKSDGTIIVSYSSAIDAPGQSTTDKAIVAAYNSSLMEWGAAMPGEVRDDGAVSYTFPSAWQTGNSLVVYLGFYNEASGESSDSVNTTATIVA